MSPSVHRIDFLCIQLDSASLASLSGRHLIRCRFGSFDKEDEDEEFRREELRREVEKKKESKEQREEEEEIEDAKWINLDTHLFLLGRSLIRQLGNVHTVTFKNHHDEDVKLTIYVGYESEHHFW